MMEEQLLKVEDVAKRLNIGKSKVYDMVADKELPHVKIGGTIIRFNKDDIDEYIAKNSYA